MNSVVTPEFADFPTSEYVSRYERMQREMKSSGLDAMIIVQRENIEYFSGFMTGHWPSKTFNSAGMILRATGAPILITPDFFSGTARKTSWVADVRYFDE